MTLVLDTNTYSEWVRDGRWAEIIRQATSILVPAPVLGELRDGFLKGSRAVQNEKTLMEFLSSDMVAVAYVGEQTSHVYARFKNELRRKGKPIPINDIWIAAVSHESGGTLLTGDKHFGFIDGLRVCFGDGE
jgi:tRNA(fMet)-specific endonuclease VapC